MRLVVSEENIPALTEKSKKELRRLLYNYKYQACSSHPMEDYITTLLLAAFNSGRELEILNLRKKLLRERSKSND